MLRTAGKARSEVLREHLDFIERLKGDQAGKLQPKDGETARAVSRRLGDAARLAGQELVTRRVWRHGLLPAQALSEAPRQAQKEDGLRPAG